RAVIVRAAAMTLLISCWTQGHTASASNTGAAACTTPTAACEQWVVFGAGPARSMVYSSYALATRNASIRRALIMVHGTNRNADHYFRTAVGAAFLAGALEDSIVI